MSELSLPSNVTKSSVPSRALMVHDFYTDLVTLECLIVHVPSYIINATCNHWTMIIFVNTEIPLSLWPAIQFFTPASMSVYLARHVWKECLFYSGFCLSSLCLPHSSIISTVGGGPKCPWACLPYYAVPHTLSHLIWNLQYKKSLSVYFTWL
jgi:hypothetical protein